MSDIVILIGGTGAKVMEALVHMAACGLYGKRNLQVFFVDLEDTNGNHLAAVKSFNYYNSSKQALNMSNTAMFETTLERLNPELWNPLGKKHDVTIDDYFNRQTMDKESGMFYDTLFTEAERNVKLDKGCLGHQNIGSVIMASKMDLKEMEPWKTVWERIQQAMGGGSPDGARVFLAGSVFGGTGAPGLSTTPAVIFQEVKDTFQKEDPGKLLSIGGFMAFPYFRFDDFDSEKTLKAKAKNFVHKTKQAVEYYAQTESINRYSAVYMAGNDVQAHIPEAVEGGPEQRNQPHFIELLGAIALVDFINHRRPESTEYNISATEKYGTIGWNDLPLSSVGRELLKKMIRFAFAFSGMYRPTLANIKEGKTAEKEAPWYKEYFHNKGLKVGDTKVEDILDKLDKYSKDFLLWLACLHASSKRGAQEQLQLVEYKFFSNEVSDEDKTEVVLSPTFSLDGFQRLVIDGMNKQDLNSIWNLMCKKRGIDASEEGLGAFVKALYDCME